MAHFIITEADDLSVDARELYDRLDEDNQEEFLRLMDEDIDEEAIFAYLDWHGLDYGLDEFEELYQGKWDSEKEFAENLINDCYNLEQMMGNLARFFDYEAFAEELFDYDYTMQDGYVFRNC